MLKNSPQIDIFLSLYLTLADEATVRFNMEVTEQTLSKQTGTEEVVSEFGASYWGCHANIQVRYLQLLKIQDKLMIRRNMRFSQSGSAAAV